MAHQLVFAHFCRNPISMMPTGPHHLCLQWWRLRLPSNFHFPLTYDDMTVAEMTIKLRPVVVPRKLALEDSGICINSHHSLVPYSILISSTFPQSTFLQWSIILSLGFKIGFWKSSKAFLSVSITCAQYGKGSAKWAKLMTIDQVLGLLHPETLKIGTPYLYCWTSLVYCLTYIFKRSKLL